MAESKVLLDDRQWRWFIRDISKKLKNAIKYLKVGASTYGFRDIIDHFRKEEGSDGKWPKRSAFTQRLYERKGKKDSRYNPSNRLLQLTGNLRKSLLPASGRVRPKGKNTVMLFTDVPYAAKHNYGEGKIPQREFMWLSDQTTQKIVDYILGQVVD